MSVPDADGTYTCDFCGKQEDWMAVEDEDSEWQHLEDKLWCGECTKLAVLDVGERL